MPALRPGHLTPPAIPGDNNTMFDRFRPHRLIRSLVEIDCSELAARGIRGVLLDLDNTLTAWRSTEIPPGVDEWLRVLQDAGLAACVVSNAATARRVQPVGDRLGLPWVTRACKPLVRGFNQGMQLLGTTPETTAMVGDQVFTDIYGGNRLGLYTILVEPYSPHEALVTKVIQRPLERLIGRVPKEE
ncbi:MAG: YqeG family HAD IIIA-type phosphatase [Armatimonadota bacterium]